ncbi:MAG: cyclic nucleotide-binding domain-containing protein [Acidobacteriota bacterium]
MPRENTHHDRVIDAIRSSGLLSELLDTHENHYKYELDLELIVYGRTYADKRIGPYARLLVYETGEEIIREGDWGGNTFYVLIEGRLEVHAKDPSGLSRRIGEIETQNSFGEMSVLAGQPRNATVVVPAGGEATVLEIRRPALRLLRKLKKFGERLEQTYRVYGLHHTLIDIQEATHSGLSAELVEKLKRAGRFTVYAKDHVLFREGDAADKLIFIKNGWVRRLCGVASDVKAARAMSTAAFGDLILELDDDAGLDFLGAGNWLGLDAFAKHQDTWSYTATVMSRTEVLEISTADLRTDRALAKTIAEHFPKFSAADDRPPERPADKRTVVATAKEISTGIIEGTNLLVMDMDKCVRCGNCSMACHKVHGYSRLLRRGIHITRPLKPNGRSVQHVLSPSVCLHCQDPECLTGCPTGAIARFDKGHIDIDPQTCIGCADCATQCPYNAISMVPRKSVATNGHGLKHRLGKWLSLAMPTVPPAVSETTDLLAVKCNLCANTTLNPPGAKAEAYSCQENCPTGALVRVNPREYFSEAKNAIGIVFQDQTHAIGRNIHKRDIPARLMHIIGLLAVIVIPSAILWAANRYTLDAHFHGTWLTLRWLTGLLGLASIAAAVTYSARKQIYRRRVGPLRYWRLAHAYLGVLAGIVLLIHGGRDSGGLVTSMLMVSFDVVIVAGLFGALCYFIVPRIMTSIEGDPLLIEDLRTRREELRETLASIDTSNADLRYLVKTTVRRRYFSLRYLLRQYIRREELTRVLADAREEFRGGAESLSDPQDRRSLIEAVETTVTLRRVDALIYLHQLLKLWLAPHVVAASLMLALMCVHIIQVTLFTVR